MRKMIGRLSGLCAALMLAACSRAADPAAAEGHPDSEYAAHVEHMKKLLPVDGFTILIAKPFVVAGDGPPEDVKRASVQTVQWAVEHLKKDFFEKEPAEVLEIYLFKDKASYDKYTREIFHDAPDTPFGYYSPAHKALIMNIATGGGTLVHEIVHPFMAGNFPKCPTWFNEGLASLFEQSAERDGHIVGLTNWRLAGLQQALSHGGAGAAGAPAFKDLMALDAADFYGANKGVNYAEARYLLLYLQENGLLRQFYHDFLKNQEKDPTGYQTFQETLAGLGEKDMAAFRSKWEKWVLQLTYP